MRTNWVKNIMLVGFFVFLFYLAFDNELSFTLRGLSLGEPDPWLLVIMIALFGVLSTYSFGQWARNITIVAVTNRKRLALHNVDPFRVTKPPQEYIDTFPASVKEIEDWNTSQGADLEVPQYPELATGEFAFYIGEGYRALRAGARGDGVIIVCPKDLIVKHYQYVDFLGEDKSYIGLDHAEVPEWVRDFCRKHIPNYIHCGTEIIYMDAPSKYAVQAWDLDQDRMVWCRGVKEGDVDYKERVEVMKTAVQILAGEEKDQEILNNKERKKRARTRKAPQPVPVQNPQPVQNGGGN